MNKPVRVLIVDDSSVTRQILARELARDPEIEVIGTASDAYIARDKILRDKPDVISLDIEMPKMDGLTFLRRLMAHHPVPVVILSSIAEQGAKAAIEALECGALDVFAKPTGGLSGVIPGLCAALKRAAGAKLRRQGSVVRGQGSGQLSHPSPLTPHPCSSRPSPLTPAVIAIGASTGGTEALRAVLTALPEDCAGILAVLHMPEGFTRRYAERLNELCALEVREAADGDRLHAGLALIARGNQHLALSRTAGVRGQGSGRSGASPLTPLPSPLPFTVQLLGGPPVNQHRPSVDVLFSSVAAAAGGSALGIIMTGMGADGADGLLAMRSAGAHTVAQDEDSCIIFGMPREAIARGGVAEVLPLDRIAEACQRWGRGAGGGAGVPACPAEGR